VERNIPHVPYGNAQRRIGSEIVVMIASPPPPDSHRAVTTHWELMRVMVPSGAPCTATSCADHGLPHVHWPGHTTASKYQGTKLRKAAWKKDVGPTFGFTASPEVGPRATVGTLQTGYPRLQAVSQHEGLWAIEVNNYPLVALTS
jgi:hypothetical protein